MNLVRMRRPFSMLIVRSTPEELMYFDLYMVPLTGLVHMYADGPQSPMVSFQEYVAMITHHRLPSRLSMRTGNCVGKSCVANDVARVEDVWQRSLRAQHGACYQRSRRYILGRESTTRNHYDSRVVLRSIPRRHHYVERHFELGCPARRVPATIVGSPSLRQFARHHVMLGHP